jgi:hypothetical protein
MIEFKIGDKVRFRPDLLSRGYNKSVFRIVKIRSDIKTYHVTWYEAGNIQSGSVVMDEVVMFCRKTKPIIDILNKEL